VLAGSEFHTVKILHSKNFRRMLQEFGAVSVASGVCAAAKLKVIRRR